MERWIVLEKALLRKQGRGSDRISGTGEGMDIQELTNWLSSTAVAMCHVSWRWTKVGLDQFSKTFV